jgi:radical SAM protein with 4Fe4S-binding SPASM domain
MPFPRALSFGDRPCHVLLLRDFKIASAMTDRPSYIQFYPTLSCNQTCSFCFNRHLKPTCDTHVSDFDRIISILKSLKIPSIDILGGEPTLHPEFMALVDLIYRHDVKVSISSNGTNTQILETLSEKYDKDSVRIGISVNGHQVVAPLHDYILKFRPALKSIFDRSGRIPDSCKQYVGMPGIDYFLLFMDVVDGDDLKNCMSFHEYYQKLNVIKSTNNGVDGVFCSGFMPHMINCPELEFVRCPAGTTKLSILPDGRVYPCYLFFRYPEFELGNIIYDDFDKIWHHPILENFRRFDGNRCPQSGCALFATCHGGCPAMSFHFYRDLQGPDPRCM